MSFICRDLRQFAFDVRVLAVLRGDPCAPEQPPADLLELERHMMEEIGDGKGLQDRPSVFVLSAPSLVLTADLRPVMSQQ